MNDKSIFLFILAAVSLFVIGLKGTWVEAAEPRTADVFVSGTDGYSYYRIPSLICTPKGTLLAFCEGRKMSILDQSPTDMLLKRSFDGGKTWRPIQVVVDAVPEAAMDPTAVIDRTTGTIILVYDRWPALRENQWKDVQKHLARPAGLGRDSITTWITTSDDDGATWSKSVDITAMTKQPEWTQTIHGPGLGIQTRTGRLVIPCARTKTDGVWWNFTIYSDDHGKTWRLSDNEVGPGVNESQIVELPDGTLLLNMRSDDPQKGCRIGATSNDGGQTWSEPFEVPELPDPSCQSSIIRYDRTDGDNVSRTTFLYSSPGTAQGRRAGTIRLSYDGAKTWNSSKVICDGFFAYSCLTAMPDGTIGVLFETADHGKMKISFLLERTR